MKAAVIAILVLAAAVNVPGSAPEDADRVRYQTSLRTTDNTSTSKCDSDSKHESNCSQFYRCHDGRLVLKHCPAGTHYNNKLKECDFPGHAQCQGVVNVQQCPGSDVCPAGDVVRLPNRDFCDKFCRCRFGFASLDNCSEGLHYNSRRDVCDWPANAGCHTKKECSKLVTRGDGRWEGQSCAQGLLGARCTLKCDPGFEMSGIATITCTELGWNGTGGLNILPECKTPEQVTADLVSRITGMQAGIPAGLLFLLDGSGSIGEEQLKLEKGLVSAFIDAFPLSKNRSAGVITFSNTATVDIPLTESNTCSFKYKLAAIKYNAGNTYLNVALKTAVGEINKNAVHNKTLIFLITDGDSHTDPSAQARFLTTKNRTLITICIGQDDRRLLETIASADERGIPLHFSYSSFLVVDIVAKYLKREYERTPATC